jgi:3-hydroxyacyl-[acyl-carrier-protein] dehydratase
MGTILQPKQLLELIPQQEPFRFVDEITEVSELGITGRFTFRANHDFYKGHFPGNPVTPGVILLESMCQVGVVAHGIYLLAQEQAPEEVRRWTTLFSDATVEFSKPVLPGTTVTIKGEKIFWRRMKLRSRVEMFDSNGQLVAQATASGMGVKL